MCGSRLLIDAISVSAESYNIIYLLKRILSAVVVTMAVDEDFLWFASSPKELRNIGVCM